MSLSILITCLLVNVMDIIGRSDMFITSGSEKVEKMLSCAKTFLRMLKQVEFVLAMTCLLA